MDDEPNWVVGVFIALGVMVVLLILLPSGLDLNLQGIR